MANYSLDKQTLAHSPSPLSHLFILRSQHLYVLRIPCPLQQKHLLAPCLEPVNLDLCEISKPAIVLGHDRLGLLVPKQLVCSLLGLLPLVRLHLTFLAPPDLPVLVPSVLRLLALLGLDFGVAFFPVLRRANSCEIVRIFNEAREQE